MEPDQDNDIDVVFVINGNVYHGNSSNIDVSTTLNDFIRDNANLKGTKYMCKEGGCGSCIVSMERIDPISKKKRIFAINSCLVPVLSCHGTSITTIEGLGNKTKGYDLVQIHLAAFNGSQCGYCSPGMIMNMYSLLKSNPQLTMQQVEDSFGGNICRCTGYRPILEAFKSMAHDADEHLKKICADIEDLSKICYLKGNCKSNCKGCKLTSLTSEKFQSEEQLDFVEDFVELSLAPKRLKFKFSNDQRWFKAQTVSEIMEIFDLILDSDYQLVAGNTARGVYPVENPPANYIDINDVVELKEFNIAQDHLEIGANVTLNDFIEILMTAAKTNYLLFGYAKKLANHLTLVAHVPVRNIGTIAGNLSIKHQHREFPSDVFLLLTTVGAQLIIYDSTDFDKTVSMYEYLETDMYKKIIKSVLFPPLSSNHYFIKTYKIMPRAQNVHAMVNAGFLLRIDKNQHFLVEEKPYIIFGGINPNFIHASDTETYLTGRSLRDESVLKCALETLSAELLVQSEPTEASSEYKHKLAIGLFYKCILNIDPNGIKKNHLSGATKLNRPLSSSKQEFISNRALWPLNQPVTKLEAMMQCSGEAEYINDIPPQVDELYGALVITDAAVATISSLDASRALKVPGVVAFFSAEDIPGTNSFTKIGIGVSENEEVFCSGKVLYAGQPVGIIIAHDQVSAMKAAKMVDVKLINQQKPLLTIKEVLNSGDPSRIILEAAINPTKSSGTGSLKIVGECSLETQYHYAMELHSCLCIPKEDQMDVYATTQWVGNTQSSIAQALNMPINSINVEVRRLGGAYGVKVTRNSLVSTACAIAAKLLNKPVRMTLDLMTSMKTIGKRYPCLAKYEVGVDLVGKIQYLIMDFYEDEGCSLNDSPLVQFTSKGITNCYDNSTWKLNLYNVKTDTPSTTWTRAPGTLEGMTTIEHIMEHIAFVTKTHPFDVRTANLLDADRAAINEITSAVMTSSDYSKRAKQIIQYNQNNRWKKKGISLVPMTYHLNYLGNMYSMVSVYGYDGTVAITTGGVEMGQGLNTKVAQVCAFTLGIPLETVKLKQTRDITSPNNAPSAASVASETAAFATLKCCEIILDRLKPLREQMGGNPKWTDLVNRATYESINLNASYMCSITEPLPKPYSIYGVAVLETVVDILTGQYQIPRVDIIEDCGESISPNVDVGQIEGAFVMGLGYFHSENLIYDEFKGNILTNRTWNYWPPGAKDIPIDFRVTFRANAPNPLGVLRSKGTFRDFASLLGLV